MPLHFWEMVFVFFPSIPLNSDYFHSEGTAWISGGVIAKTALTDWGEILAVDFAMIISLK